MRNGILHFFITGLIVLGASGAYAVQGTCDVKGGLLTGPSLHAQIGSSPLTLSIRNAQTGTTVCVVQQLQSYKQNLMGKLGYEPYLYWEGVGCGIRWSLTAGDFSCWAKVGVTEYQGEGYYSN